MDKDLVRDYVHLVREGAIKPLKCYCDGGDTHMLYVETVWTSQGAEYVLECYACGSKKFPGNHLVNHIRTLVEGAKNG